MTLELAGKVHALMNELDEVKSLRHGMYKTRYTVSFIRQEVSKYNKRIDEIKKEIEAL